MLIIPAIDLYQGKVVRLFKGDINRSKVYSDNPLGVARQWEAQGAKFLHLVDLSAAFEQGDNLAAIKSIIKSLKIKVEVGGGIRDLRKAKALISLGVERVIIGTKGLDDNFLTQALKAVGAEKLAVSVDVKDSFVAVCGWQEKTTVTYLEFIDHLKKKGIKWIIHTDISRDGTLKGVDLEILKQLSVYKDINLIISGGISSLEDIKNIKKQVPLVWGIILGKALYEAEVSLCQANSIADNDNNSVDNF
jgi:phosphoribosylformimino-5-aminoimidazole carboxamide ribotide isomerase